MAASQPQLAVEAQAKLPSKHPIPIRWVSKQIVGQAKSLSDVNKRGMKQILLTALND